MISSPNGLMIYTVLRAAMIYQTCGLDKKRSNPTGLLAFLEVTIRFELMDNGVADRGLTTWLRHHTLIVFDFFFCVKKQHPCEDVAFKWSGLRGSNPPPQPWQGCALPNELNPHMVPPVGIEPTTRGFSVPCSTN